MSVAALRRASLTVSSSHFLGGSCTLLSLRLIGVMKVMLVIRLST